MANVIDVLRGSGREPRFHGNGFTQLYVGEKMRLHVWHPDLKKFDEHNAQIHNHRYDVYSRVLYGKLQHAVYEEHYNLTREANYDKHRSPDNPSIEDRPWQIYEVTKSGELEYVGGCWLALNGRYYMAAGSEYWFPHPWYHTSDAIDLTVTLFTIGPNKVERPRVLCLRGEKPTDAFDASRSPPVDLLWAAIEEALKKGEVAYHVRQSCTELFI